MLFCLNLWCYFVATNHLLKNIILGHVLLFIKIFFVPGGHKVLTVKTGEKDAASKRATSRRKEMRSWRQILPVTCALDQKKDLQSLRPFRGHNLTPPVVCLVCGQEGNLQSLSKISYTYDCFLLSSWHFYLLIVQNHVLKKKFFLMALVMGFLRWKVFRVAHNYRVWEVLFWCDFSLSPGPSHPLGGSLTGHVSTYRVTFGVPPPTLICFFFYSWRCHA